MNKGPIQTYKAGPITAKIWENIGAGKDGQSNVYHTVSLERSYQDKNREWKTTTNMRVADLPKAELVLKKAYEFLVLKRSEDAIASLLETGKIPVEA